MSEQNSMAISPVTAGLVGAAAGGIGNYFLGVGARPEKGYQDVKELLTLKKDKFEELKKDVEASDNTAAKEEFKKLENGRVTVSAAGDQLVKDQTTARTEMNKAILAQAAETDAAKKLTINVATEEGNLNTAKSNIKTIEDGFKKGSKVATDAAGNEITWKDANGVDHKRYVADDSTDLGKAIKKYRDAFNAEVAKITGKQDEGLGKELKDLEASKAGKSGDELKTIEAQIKAKKAEIGRKALEADTVKTAKEELHTEKAKITTPENLKTKAGEVTSARDAYNKKLVSEADSALANVTADDKAAEGTLAKLKSKIEAWKKTLDKTVDSAKSEKAAELVGDNGSLKDLDMGKFKKFLPKAKMIPALIAAGVLGAAGVALAYIVGPKNEVPTDVA